jgi:protein-S-isoprenylcysteine O-methyltransferase Ste14
VQIAGALLVIASLWLVLRSAVLLAGRGRPRRGPRPAFVIAGPYRRMRNPLLAGLVLALAGAGPATGRTWPLVLAVAAAGAAHVWVVRVEEPRLRARFGAAYDAYLRCVPRWLPRPLRDGDDTM